MWILESPTHLFIPSSPQTGTLLQHKQLLSLSSCYSFVQQSQLAFSALLLHWSNSQWEPQPKEFLHVPVSLGPSSPDLGKGSVAVPGRGRGSDPILHSAAFPSQKKGGVPPHSESTQETQQATTSTVKHPNCGSSNLQI